MKMMVPIIRLGGINTITSVQICYDRYYAMNIADLDHDGDLDIISASKMTSLLENDGSNDPSFLQLIFSPVLMVQDIEFGRYGYDGDLDIVSAH